MSIARMVREFNEHPNSSGPAATRDLLPTLHEEERNELIEALVTGDRAKIARELADVVYLAYTEAWAREIDLDAALSEIHRAAMDKMRANVRRADGKIIKPPGFVPPDMAAAVTHTLEPSGTNWYHAGMTQDHRPRIPAGLAAKAQAVEPRMPFARIVDWALDDWITEQTALNGTEADIATYLMDRWIAEICNSDLALFDRYVAQARQAWNDELDRQAVETEHEDDE